MNLSNWEVLRSLIHHNDDKEIVSDGCRCEESGHTVYTRLFPMNRTLFCSYPDLNQWVKWSGSGTACHALAALGMVHHCGQVPHCIEPIEQVPENTSFCSVGTYDWVGKKGVLCCLSSLLYTFRSKSLTCSLKSSWALLFRHSRGLIPWLFFGRNLYHS